MGRGGSHTGSPVSPRALDTKGMNGMLTPCAHTSKQSFYFPQTRPRREWRGGAGLSGAEGCGGCSENAGHPPATS